MEVITLDQLANVMRAYPLKGIVSRQEFDALYVGGSRIDPGQRRDRPPTPSPP